MPTVNVLITSKGDPSVGIPHAHWELENVDFEEEYREQFREALETAFDYVADPVMVQFSDELPENPEDS